MLYWGGVLVCLGIMVGSVMAVAMSAYLVKVTENDDAVLNLTNIKWNLTSIIYYPERGADGKETGEFNEYQRLQNKTENRIWVDLGDISPYVVDAYIAVEDKDFKDHKGVNLKRTIAAMINEYSPIKLFASKQGASTITQQLVKNLTNDTAGSGLQGALRKAREIFRAYMLEKRYSKEIILEAYLNTLGLSGQLAGVQAGANAYFGKDISEVTLAQAASIAGITKSPTYYNPFINPENNLERRNHILGLMLEQEKITQEEYDTAIAEELILTGKAPEDTKSYNSYFTDMVVERVIKDLMAKFSMTEGEATSYFYNSGLKIYSTVDPTVQSAMEAEFADGSKTFPVKETKVKDKVTGEEKVVTPQAAMASIDYTGAIVGTVGGLGTKTEDRSFNRAVDAIRPVGSTMKPIGAYAPALDYKLITYSTGYEDNFLKMMPDKTAPEGERPWPKNYSGTYSEATIPVVKAIAKSLNTIAVKVEDVLGPKTAYDFLKDTLHITSLTPQDMDISPMALGSLTYGISPLEMAAAYAMFGNGGKYTTPHCYTTVEDSSGDIILETKVTTVQAISPETAYIMNRALKQVLLPEGTANGLAPKRLDAVGKTGTTSDDKDHWFIGLTPYYSTATWWGYDDQVTLTVNYRSHPPTTAWRNVMNVAQEKMDAKSFPVSKNVVTMTYCDDSGDLANPTCPSPREGYYTEDNLPGMCIMH
ncbi:MAG: transglycosylase domain-containing protein [Oscillospiraceae bacterium]